MEDILTQRFSYATITHYKNYCRIDDKLKGQFLMSNNMDAFDSEEISIKSFLNQHTIGRIVDLPEKSGKRRTNFFYNTEPVGERFNLIYAFRDYHTTKDRHIKRHYGNSFSKISVHTIEKSIRRHGDKVTIKIYRHTRYREFNSIYFRKSSSVSSITFNLVTGNFTTMSFDGGKKSKRHFRTNNFKVLSALLDNNMRSIFGKDDYVPKMSNVYGEYSKIFDSEEFIRKMDFALGLNQGYIFDRETFESLIMKKFIDLKRIKVSDDYEFLIKYFYPTEKYLAKNERKLIASILDMFKIKSKINIKLMHNNPKINLFCLSNLCYLFGDDFSKYIATINSKCFELTSYSTQNYDNLHNSVSGFLQERTDFNFNITNIEKENVVKIFNSYDYNIYELRNSPFSISFIVELYDHFNMINKLREYIPNLYLKARNHIEFSKEHSELSKMMSMVKKGWVNEYKFASQMVEDIEKPIEVKINLGTKENPVYATDMGKPIIFYPHILKRDEEYSEEGTFMHHCVASYSDKYRSIIISIRTEDKSDRITCEFDCQTGNLVQARHFCNRQPPPEMELASLELLTKTKLYARMGLLHSIERKKVPVKINGIEIKVENVEPRRYNELPLFF